VFTVFGASGLVGTALCEYLAATGEEVYAAGRFERGQGRQLGHVVYCIGDDRVDRDPFAVVDTHVSILAEVLRQASYKSFLYLSTTRLYMEGPDASENACFKVNLADPNELFNLTKLTGEALCLAIPNEKVRIARLSNVTGVNPDSHLFLPTLIRDALQKGRINLYLAQESAKDYILLHDVVELIVRIANSGTRRIYNVASGTNISAGQIVKLLQEETGCVAEWHEQIKSINFARIDVTRIQNEFLFQPKSVLEGIPEIIERTRQELKGSLRKNPRATKER